MTMKCPDGWKPLPSFSMGVCDLCRGDTGMAYEGEKMGPIRHKPGCKRAPPQP